MVDEFTTETRGREDAKGDRQSTDRTRMTDRDMDIKLGAEIAAKNERRYRDGWQ